MTITELKTIAADYGLELLPFAFMRSHILYRWIDGRLQAIGGRYEDKKLTEKMTEQAWADICHRAANPPKPTAEEAAELRAAEIERRKRGRSIVSGRYTRMEKA